MPYTYQKNADGHFVCGTCDAVKKNQNTMHYHMKSHEGKPPFECTICKKGFLQSQSLAVHMAARHPTEESQQLECPCCEFKTVTKANRIIHYVRKHCQEHLSKALALEDGVYGCTICEKKMKSNTAFHYHVASCLQLGEKQKELDSIL